MKKLAILFAVLISSVLSAGEGIRFAEGNWEAIRDKAQKENKYIFLDGFTDWCYWCKVMDKQTFPDKAVAELLNTKFISVKRDMERGEGKQLSMKYHVASFPTYLVFSPQGELVYSIVGFREPADFIAELNNAMNPEKHEKRPGLSAVLDPGYPEFYKNAFGPSKERVPAKEEEINTFLDGQKDLMSEVAWSVMWRFPLSDKHADYLINNRAAYVNLYGAYNVDNKVQQIFLGRVKQAADEKDENAFNKVYYHAQKAYPDDPRLAFEFKLTYYSGVKDWEKYASSYEDYARNGVSPGITNMISWTLFEECDDKVILGKAVIWMKEASDKEPSYAIIDTYASLLYKTGNLDEAEIQAKRAIAQGKKEGEGTDATKELLEKIKAAKKTSK
ncbi:MAG: thioredoxin family protein [Bacteroidia bacterium]